MQAHSIVHFVALAVHKLLQARRGIVQAEPYDLQAAVPVFLRNPRQVREHLPAWAAPAPREPHKSSLLHLIREDLEGYEATPVEEERGTLMMLQCVLVAGGAQVETHHVAQSSMMAGWPLGGRSVGSPFKTFRLPAKYDWRRGLNCE